MLEPVTICFFFYYYVSTKNFLYIKENNVPSAVHLHQESSRFTISHLFVDVGLVGVSVMGVQRVLLVKPFVAVQTSELPLFPALVLNVAVQVLFMLVALVTLVTIISRYIFETL